MFRAVCPMAHPVPSSTLDIEMAISVAARTIGSRTLARPGGLWAMLFARLLLFAGWQGVFVVAFAVSGSTRPLQDSAAWWLMTATLANLTNLGMLGWLTHREGRKLRSLLNFDRSTWRRDLLWGGGSLLVLVPLGVFPGPLLGTALFWKRERADVDVVSAAARLGPDLCGGDVPADDSAL